MDEEDSWGHYSQAKQNIELAQALLPEGSKWGEILLHEIGHGIVDNWNIPLGDGEEDFVRAYTLGLLDTMRKNKTLFRAILKALK